MSFTDRFLPPPGAPGAIRDAAGAWRDCAGRVRALGDEVNTRASVLSSSWWGPSKEAFVAQTWPFLRQVDAAAADLEQYAGLLDKLADGIDAAQREFHARMIAVGATLVIGAALTVFTATLSDEAALAAVTAEVATATELATTAATQALTALSWLTAQASQLGLRVLVFSGVNVAGDAVGAGVAYGDGRPWAHLHLREDVEWGAIGGVAVPLGAGMLSGLAARGVSLGGASGAAIKLGVGGLSMAQADVLVRSALGERVDAAELAMAALPISAAGHIGKGNAEAPAVATGIREPPAGFDLVPGLGTRTRVLVLRRTRVPEWGLTAAHILKHLTGNGPSALRQIDPLGTTDRWLGYLQELGSRPASASLKGGIQDIVGEFPRSDGSGSFKLGIRISPRTDGTYDLVTILTKQ